MKLHLGVNDIPYAHSPDGTTTYEVASILEGKYGIFQAFFDANKEKVAGYLEQSVAGALETLMMGGPKSATPFARGEAQIEGRFKEFLALQEVERIGIKGVPTQAALDGVSHRFKNPRFENKRGKKVKRKRRPSFIDTGLYQANMRAWMDTDG